MSSKKPTKNTSRVQPSRQSRPRQPAPRQMRPATRVSTAALARSQGTVVPEPKFVSRTARSTRIVHSEAIATITGSAAFSVAQAYALNPGLAATFPWLSTQAVGWERYRFHKLRFVYYSRIGADNNGSFLFSPDYDAADPAPTTEDQATSYRGAVEAVPWTTNIAISLDPVSLLQAGPSKLVRTGPLAANEDITLRDGGNLYVCTNSGAAIGWGKLWVEYDVELMLPQLVTVALPPASSTTLTRLMTGGTASATAYLGTAPTITGVAGVVTASAATITFVAAGTYRVTLVSSGTAPSGGAPTQSGTASTSVLIAAVAASNSESIVYTVVSAAGQTLALDLTPLGFGAYYTSHVFVEAL